MIRVAVLVTAGTRPKDLSAVLDAAIKYDPEILQFAVEGHGWPGDGDPPRKGRSGMRSSTTPASRLLEDPDEPDDDLV